MGNWFGLTFGVLSLRTQRPSIFTGGRVSSVDPNPCLSYGHEVERERDVRRIDDGGGEEEGRDEEGESETIQLTRRGVHFS